MMTGKQTWMMTPEAGRGSEAAFNHSTTVSAVAAEVDGRAFYDAPPAVRTQPFCNTSVADVDVLTHRIQNRSLCSRNARAQLF